MVLHWPLFFTTFFALNTLLYVSNRRPSDQLGKTPDYDRYVQPRILTEEELGLDDPARRLIVIGDVHGMNASFQNLLQTLSYTPTQDTLLLTGDLLTKATVPGAIAVLSFLTQHNVPAVRGNQDQPVVRWRVWQDEIERAPGGARWLADLDARYAEEEAGWEEWIERERRRPDTREWWARIPERWEDEVMKRHYQIARAMTPEHHDYLLRLPTIIHAPSLHTFFVHAGLLASNPLLPLDAPSQPLAVPAADRTDQEARILTEIAPNGNPWANTNMRTILPDGTVSRLHIEDAPEGSAYWPEEWTATMQRCSGFIHTSSEESSTSSSDATISESDRGYIPPQAPLKDRRAHARKERSKKTMRLPCEPATVVYGHVASQGLDIRRWTVGLDSGCVYGRALSALVLGGGRRNRWTLPHWTGAGSPVERRKIRFGDAGRAWVVSVSCEAEAGEFLQES